MFRKWREKKRDSLNAEIKALKAEKRKLDDETAKLRRTKFVLEWCNSDLLRERKEIQNPTQVVKIVVKREDSDFYPGDYSGW